MRKISLLVLVLVVLAGLAIVQVSDVRAVFPVTDTIRSTATPTVTPHGPVRVVTADNFTSNGDLILGWYWLRDPAFTHYGQWEFSGIPTSGVVGGFIYIRFDPLVTNTVNGGSGYSTRVRVTYSRGARNVTRTVMIMNTHPEFSEPRDTQGWGYGAFGWIKVPIKQVPSDGKITVRLVRMSAQPKHIAVNATCCTIEYVVP